MRPRVYSVSGQMHKRILSYLRDKELYGQPVVIINNRGFTTLDFARTNGWDKYITRYIHPHGQFRKNRNNRDNKSIPAV